MSLPSPQPRLRPSPAALERREFKYLVPPEGIAALRRLLRRVASPDAHAGPDGTYLIRSLYLDTSDLRLYRANDREAPERFKARIRCYPGSADPRRAFYEIKRRTLDVIRKTRFAAPRGWAKLPLAATLWHQADDPSWERFATLVHTYGLTPKVLVQYRREAWMSELDDYARVSIDRAITYQPMLGWSLEAPPSGWTGLDHASVTWTRAPVAVVELKFANAPPRWMLELVGSLELIRHSFSKYGYSMTAWKTPPPPRSALGRAT